MCLVSAIATGVLVASVAAVLAAGAGLAYETIQIRRAPPGNPRDFIRRGRTVPNQKVVVCLGASIVHGAVSVSFVDMLRRRWPAPDHAIVNAGVNGDLAYNALQRLDEVVACEPAAVVVLVGTNDVTSTLSESTRRLAMRSKKLPCEPSMAWYAAQTDCIVVGLQARTHATIALCSLPILGEDLAAPANARVREFNAALSRIARQRNVAYLPVHERQADSLAARGATRGRPYVDKPFLVIGAGIRHILFRESLDAISRRRGLALTTDLIHMNTDGATIIADEVHAFLRQALQ